MNLCLSNVDKITFIDTKIVIIENDQLNDLLVRVTINYLVSRAVHVANFSVWLVIIGCSGKGCSPT